MFKRTDTLVLLQTQSASMTIIEIRPFRNGWKCFEAPGVEPVFLNQEQAIDYATGRACFRSGEIRVLDSRGAVELHRLVVKEVSQTPPPPPIISVTHVRFDENEH